jgi:hypothetical protein
MKRFAPALALVFLFIPALFAADTKSEIVVIGKPHMEFDCPSNMPLHLQIRSGEIDIVGSDENKITIDFAGRNSEKIQDVKARLAVGSNIVRFFLTGGPQNEFQMIIHVPKNSDLTARVFAGEVHVQNVTGNKDFELHAGELNISVGNPQEYGRVEMSVNAGEVDAEVFGGSKGGLFRSLSRDNGGKYHLRAHVGTGELNIR